MKRRIRPPGLRTRILLVVLVALLPMAVLGLWILGTAERSAEDVLRSRLEQSLTELTGTVGSGWVRYRSLLLDLAEADAARDALRGTGAVAEGGEPLAPAVRAAWNRLEGAAALAEFRDAAGRSRGALGGPAGPEAEPAGGGTTFDVRLAIHDGPLGERIGTLEARLAVSSLLADAPWWARVGGSVLEVFDTRTGTPLLASPIEPDLLLRETFLWEGERWAAAHRWLQEPPLLLALAAPMTPSVEPFRETARRGTLALLAALALSVALAIFFARRTVRPLSELATAADAVSRGELERRAPESGPDEIRRVARAFNEMTESLRRTLAALARQESLAAVGEFAASLSHEIRNPLTSVRLDLQRAARALHPDDPSAGLVRRALEELDGLEGTVSTALRLARSGRVRLAPLDLREPLEAALREVRPLFASRGLSLESTRPPEPVRVLGDAGALEQLFRNLLVNAAEAMDRGGSARVRVEPDGDRIRISVEDDGPGIAAEARERIFEPLFSTKEGGTGLGLPIARRIAHAHRTELEVESAPGKGTAVRLSLAAPEAA